MKFVLASSIERKASELFELLGDLSYVEFRRGSLSEVSDGCDAVIMHYTLAHSRYGGRPVVGKAQVLRNVRNDPAPPIVLATPPLEEGSGMGLDKNAETEKHTARMIEMALDAWVKSAELSGDSASLVCLIHLEGTGLDFGPMDAICDGLRRAMNGYC